MESGYYVAMDPDGRERLVVVVKGTFMIPTSGKQPELMSEQTHLVTSDEFAGDEGDTPLVHGVDFVPVKPRCDILLNGRAYAPRGKRVTLVRVRLMVGNWSKEFDVWGERTFERTSLGVAPSSPEPFEWMAIDYSRAYGGTSRESAYSANPIGRGYYPTLRGAELVGAPLANTGECGVRPDSPAGDYRPMSFGAIGRNFAERMRLAGTYDSCWYEETFPFLPDDFNILYYQSSPADQQVPHLDGSESVSLFNLSPDGYRQFTLPKLSIPVEFFLARGPSEHVSAKLDTLLIEPDLDRFSLTWRASRPLRRNIFELDHVVVGELPRAWRRARQTGRTYFPSLAAAVQHSHEEADIDDEEL